MRGFFILMLFLWSTIGYGQVLATDSVVLSGVVIHAGTGLGLADVHCRYGNGKIAVSDEDGCFRLKLQRGDSVRFTYVGFKPCLVVVPDTLYDREYAVGVFMSPDTVSLSEVLIVRRWQDSWYRDWKNMRNNMSGVLRDAFAPVKQMDAGMNQRMMIDEYARKVEMKGHVDMKFGVGTQSVATFRLMNMRKRLDEKKDWIYPEEVDLLKKLYYSEKREKQDN